MGGLKHYGGRHWRTIASDQLRFITAVGNPEDDATARKLHDRLQRTHVNPANQYTHAPPTHCKRNHLLAPPNLIHRNDGARMCAQCKRDRDAGYRSNTKKK